MHQTKNKSQDWHHFKNNNDFNVPHNEFVNYINTEKISIVLAKKKDTLHKEFTILLRNQAKNNKNKYGWP